MQKKIIDTLLEERERWLLWVPVALGLGAVLYFSLPFEPFPWLSIMAMVFALGAAIAFQNRPILASLSIITFLIALGCSVAHTHTIRSAAPALNESTRLTTISGRVAEVAVLPDGSKLVLDNVRINGIEPQRTPRKITLNLRKGAQTAGVGDMISLRGGLYPPPGAALPGAFDFSRHFYFKQIGAVGFGIPPVKIETIQAKNDFTARVAHLRFNLTENIRTAMEEPYGAVATALVTGETRAIPEEINETMRTTGLYHLLAVSGMNLALVAGIVFFSVRFMLVLIPGLALRTDIKKWAAFIAWLATFAYLNIAGWPVSGERAFVMITLLLGAVMLDRAVTPMRSLAWAAIAILLVQPQAVLSAGFQLSFAATIGLVAFYERIRELPEIQFVMRKIIIYVGGVFFSSLVAGLATTPFLIYHFGQFSTYSLLANMLVIPIVSFWITPCAIVALLLLPLKLGFIGFVPMQWGIEWMLAIARFFEKMPQSIIYLPPLTGWGLGILALGALWLCLWQTRWRWWGVLPVASGLATIWLYSAPDILVGETGKNIAVRLNDGQVAMIKGRGDSFIGKQWARALQQEDMKTLSKKTQRGMAADSFLRCDKSGCLYGKEGYKVAFIEKDRSALDEDCSAANVVVTGFYLSAQECDALRIIDRRALEQQGTHALWLNEKGLKIKSVMGGKERRAWQRLQ